MAEQAYTVLADNVIEYRIKQVYGVNTMYVVSEHVAAITMLTGNKTLSYIQKIALEQLGFVFKQVL